MVKIDMDMPSCCNDCWALDESGDYPMCRITLETRGYTFNARERRMDKCPLIEEKPTQSPCAYCQEFTCEGCEYWNGR